MALTSDRVGIVAEQLHTWRLPSGRSHCGRATSTSMGLTHVRLAHLLPLCAGGCCDDAQRRYHAHEALAAQMGFVWTMGLAQRVRLHNTLVNAARRSARPA